ncbi:MAG: hypothetical protein JST28_14080 [Acidobacteria bacterium]|nr:hypothetical protein [Acidobacteriota bacterium]
MVSRISGESMPMNPFQRRGQKARLNPEQHIFVPAFGFSVFVGISDLTDRWLRWKWYSEGSFDQYVVGGAIMAALIAGSLYGLWTAFASRRVSQD